jgi:nonsense-mediated mRNA decay protein 3
VSYNPSDIKALRDKEQGNLPDIVLVRKFYPKYRSKIRNRDWKLKSLAYEAPDAPGVGVGLKSLANEGGRDMELFMQEIEEDPEMRQKINLYRDPVAQQLAERKAAAAKIAAANGDTEIENEEVEEDAPRVTLDELLDEMRLEDGAADSEAVIVDVGKPLFKISGDDDDDL